tara:strand:- start:1225 stop:1545 length:321 start_codon:yes stop_codon:yes gene_type:complete
MNELDLEIQRYRNLLDHLTRVHTKRHDLDNNNMLLQIGVPFMMYPKDHKDVKGKQELIEFLDIICNMYGIKVGFTYATIQKSKQNNDENYEIPDRQSPSPIFTLEL